VEFNVRREDTQKGVQPLYERQYGLAESLVVHGKRRVLLRDSLETSNPIFEIFQTPGLSTTVQLLGLAGLSGLELFLGNVQ
jgi:hypothetical protein